MALVTVSEIKILGRIDYDEADSLLESLIEEATEFIEEYCEIKLSNITYIEERADGGGINLLVKNKPITSVTEIKDGFSDDEVMDSDEYFFVETRIVANEVAQWGTGELRWKVTYNAGYTDENAPKGLKLPLRNLVLLAFDNPESKSRQAAGGYGCDWRSLAEENDITATLDRFSLRRYLE